MICFYHKSDLDGVCSAAIVKSYGGGGHAGAAGFSVAELPFWLPLAGYR